MYIYGDMIDKGLPDGVSWPTPTHRTVAQNLLMFNPAIRNMRDLQNGVVNILNIPEEKIETISIHDLDMYGFDVTTEIRPRGL